ncbi:MAG TPA: ATP-binding protein [Solirubrobacterales bacterium]|nr:ATP-binding protein [Solirubrobacterales bacterium]
MLAAEADLGAVLDLVARRGRALVAARGILIETREGSEMVVAATAGEVPQGLIGRSVGAIPDPVAEARLVVPLSLWGRTYGAIVALGSEFSIEDEEMLEILAAGAAAAVATGRLRSLIAELRPPALDELGVGAAIEALADQVESPALEIQTWIELGAGEGRIEAGQDEELKTAVYRIVQEALDNAVRHAHPSCIVIQVVDDGSGIRITVRDDGTGFDPTVARGGFGLKRIRERVELFGGSLEIASAVDGGAEVRAAIPASLAAARSTRSGRSPR